MRREIDDDFEVQVASVAYTVSPARKRRLWPFGTCGDRHDQTISCFMSIGPTFSQINRTSCLALSSAHAIVIHWPQRLPAGKKKKEIEKNGPFTDERILFSGRQQQRRALVIHLNGTSGSFLRVTQHRRFRLGITLYDGRKVLRLVLLPSSSVRTMQSYTQLNEIHQFS